MTCHDMISIGAPTPILLASTSRRLRHLQFQALTTDPKTTVYVRHHQKTRIESTNVPYWGDGLSTHRDGDSIRSAVHQEGGRTTAEHGMRAAAGVTGGAA